MHGDCLAMMRTLESDSVDSVVTDPPYGLAQVSPDLITKTMIAWATGDREFIPEGVGFMGKTWDSFVPPPAVWDEVYRVLKPGGHVLAFAGSRTVDLMSLSIRLANFELRDSLSWNFGSGFPKSMSIDKAIDKAAGAEREVVGVGTSGATAGMNTLGQSGIKGGDYDLTAPATDDAKKWSGWGTALKPAHEPIVMARKPLSEKTVAANVLKHGTGGINIDGSRVGTEERVNEPAGGLGLLDNLQRSATAEKSSMGNAESARSSTVTGRFPSNVIFDEFTASLLDEQSGISKSSAAVRNNNAAVNHFKNDGRVNPSDANRTTGGHADQGGASRFFKTVEHEVDPLTPFFYQAKANRSERPVVDGVAHPTVKPLALMRYLAKLVTPVGGTVLEPFAGSGTTVEACILEGLDVIAIEREGDYIPLIKARVARQLNGGLS